ncbi:MAG: LamG domain-containing protein [Labilithrix sp.]|nr:LamG domain-containing protein [Labilithrix sp.]
MARARDGVWGALVVVAAACGFDGVGTAPGGAPSDGGVPEGSPSPIEPPTDAGPQEDADADAGVCHDPALRFEGRNDAIVPHAPALDLVGPFTVEAWIRPDLATIGEEQQILSHHQHDDGGWVLLVRNRRIEMRLYGRSSIAVGVLESYFAGNAGNAYVMGDRWAHVAGVYDGTTLAVYYAGARRHTLQPTSFSYRTYGGDAHVGRAAYTDNFYFRGLIDEVRVSSAARYTTEAIAVPTAPFAVDGTTVGLWHFDEPSGNTIVDATTAHPGAFAAGAEPIRVLDAPCIDAR